MPRVEEEIASNFRLLGEKGLAWIGEQLERVRPTDFSDASTLKDVTELGILYRFLLRWSQDPASPHMQRIRSYLVEVCDDLALSHFARRLPAAYTAFFILYLALRAEGHTFPHYESAYRALERLGYPGALELLPFRRIEIEYFAWQAGLRPRPSGWEKLVAESTLGLAENPIYLSSMEAYSITHTLFYLSDFAGPCDAMPSGLLRKAERMTECLLLSFWRKADWDLTGELLLNRVALGQHKTPLFEAAAGALCRAWRPDGVLPGPYSHADDDAEGDFKNSFHTTLVGLLLTHAYGYRVRQEASA